MLKEYTRSIQDMNNKVCLYKSKIKLPENWKFMFQNAFMNAIMEFLI